MRNYIWRVSLLRALVFAAVLHVCQSQDDSSNYLMPMESSSDMLDNTESLIVSTIVSSEISLTISFFETDDFESMTMDTISSTVEVIVTPTISDDFLSSSTPTDIISSSSFPTSLFFTSSSSALPPSSTTDVVSSVVVPSSTLPSSSLSSTQTSDSITPSSSPSTLTPSSSASPRTPSPSSSTPLNVVDTATSSSALPTTTFIVTTSSATSSTLPTTTESQVGPTITNELIGILVGGLIVLALLAVTIMVLVIILLGIRKRKRSNKYVLQGVLASENTENMILLQEMSTSMPELEKKFDDIFAHIPAIPPFPLYKLEHHINELLEGEDESNAIDEFESLLPHTRDAPCIASETRSNVVKNRYINILPFDDTRVVLNTKADYINANYIAGHNNHQEYIATQGPVPHTINDFWQMIWQTGCDTIVMVTNPVEAGITKCEVYWPEEEQATQFNNIGVTNMKEVVKPSYTVRTFVLSVPEKKSKSSSRLVSSRECKQFHFTAWPDMGVPIDVATVLRFIKQVRGNLKSTVNPIIIHCSAGVGRTGTFIAIDVQMQRMKIKNNVNIKEMVLRLRAQRGNMVQTVPQYMFIYNCLLHEYLFDETEVNSSNINDHYDTLLDVFPDTEDSRLEKQFQGANEIILPDESLLEAATNPDNVAKNREGAGVPLDLNRVHLNDSHSSGIDYINASYLGVFGRKAEFVVTQHPLDKTREDFWRMMVERNFSTIVFIGPIKEEDVYWPVNEPLEYSELQVRLIEEEEEEYVKVFALEVESEETEECITVKLFQLKNWPIDSDVPTSPKGILQLSELVSEHSTGLLVVHESASVLEQCSGVFCVIHSLSKHLVNGETVDVMGSTRKALQQRQGCISTKEQYQFIYEALLERLTQ